MEKKNQFDSLTFKKAFIASLPTLAGYTFMGIAFGLLLNKIGYNFIWAGLMGLFIYGGTMQFVAVDLLANQTALLSVALITFLIYSTNCLESLKFLFSFK